MKTVKFAICCILTAVCLAIPSRPALIGTGEVARYARADERDVYFCKEMLDETALFAIPYTYCVEIISTAGEWYYVKYADDVGLYQSMYGYCRKRGLTPVDEPPENIYLYKSVSVTYKPDTGNISLPVLGEMNVTAAFYGTFYSGASAYSYVLYDGEFGYINGANDDYPLNEIPVIETPDPPAKPANVKLIVALVVGGIAVAALLVLYFSGKNARFKKR